MERDTPLWLQEVLFSSSDPQVSRKINSLEKKGKLRKLAPRVYTSNQTDPPEDIIRRNLFTILGKLFPGAVLSHRSAIEFKPTASGHIFLTYKYTRNIRLPGLTVGLLQGEGPIDGDNLLAEGLYAAQPARAYLENFQSVRKYGPEAKTLTAPELEEQLEKIVRVSGEGGLNALRDRAKPIAQALGMTKEYDALDLVIGALLSSKPSKILASPVATARAFGIPYDPARIALFGELFAALKQQVFPDFPEQNTSVRAFRNFAFFEAYFSNFIEGTEFEIDEAWQIIETQRPLPLRNEDSHDILGTYKLVSNPDEMRTVPQDADDLLRILRYRHAVLMQARPTKQPGEFKDQNNRAGNTRFVDFQLARGTLIKGFELYRALTDPFARAAFMMFMVSEVHPFLDGNGRVARVMMNAELVAAGKAKIIIPTVYRDDYIGALRQLTRQGKPAAFVRMLARAHRFSAAIHGADIDAMRTQLEAAEAFHHHQEGKLRIAEPGDYPSTKEVPPERPGRRGR